VGCGQPDEYLLHPKAPHKTRPLDPASLHRRFKVWLNRAGLPATVKLHELRHSAADNLWRASGNLMLAKQLLRQESVATTDAYLHPSRDDLTDALPRLEVVRSPSQSDAESDS
jgi:site-specific recombinase XerC